MRASLATGSGAALMLGLAFPALAQEAPAASGAQTEGLGEIVVTAQRRTERLQDVPVAATALSADALAENAVTSLADLQSATPALSVSNSGFIQSVNIRGIGLASDSPNVTAGVATYVDGLFQPPIFQANSFYDLASVEVLRGPQGTLVGSNSTGGAIFINSRNPDLNTGVGGYGELAYGSYNNIGAEGALNLPISSTLGVRVAGFYRGRDSYYDDVGPFDNDAGKLVEKGGRVTVMWQPGSFSAIAKVHINERDSGGYPYRPIPGTPFAPYRVGDQWTLSFDEIVGNRDLAFMASLELRQELSGGTVIRSVSGYQNKRIKNLYDVDGSQAPLAAGGDTSQDYFAGERQYSQEVNIISPPAARSTGFWAAISSVTTSPCGYSKARAASRPISRRSTSVRLQASLPRAILRSAPGSSFSSAAAIRPTRRPEPAMCASAAAFPASHRPAFPSPICQARTGIRASLARRRSTGN